MSTCNTHSSGCHSFGHTLNVQFPNMIHVRLVFQPALHALHPLQKEYRLVDGDLPLISHSTLEENLKYTTLIITGCGWKDSPSIVQFAQENYKFTGLTHFYIISPPHTSYTTHMYLSHFVKKLKNSFTAVPTAQIELLISGMDHKTSRDIGLPKPLPLLSSKDEETKFEVPKNCYGVIYAKHATFDTEYKENKNITVAYLKTFFSHAKFSAINSIEPIVSIIVIAPNKLQKISLDKITAEDPAIKILYFDRLPPSDFIHLIQAMAEKRGIIGVDGVQTLIQALYLKASPFVIRSSAIRSNAFFYKELMAHITDAELLPYAEVMLGINQDFAKYSLLERNTESITKVVDSLHSAIAKSVNKFETDQKKDLTSPETSIRGFSFLGSSSSSSSSSSSAAGAGAPIPESISTKQRETPATKRMRETHLEAKAGKAKKKQRPASASIIVKDESKLEASSLRR